MKKIKIIKKSILIICYLFCFSCATKQVHIPGEEGQPDSIEEQTILTEDGEEAIDALFIILELIEYHLLYNTF